MNRFDGFDRSLGSKKLLACYLPFGDPDVSGDLKAVYADCGVDIIELGLPCSNPYADGPVVANSMRRSFEHNPELSGLPQYLESLRETAKEAAVVIMGYEKEINCRRILDKAGDYLDGVLSMGQPADAPKTWSINNRKLYNICFAPYNLEQQSLEIAKNSGGYIMLQAVEGTTGMRSELGDLTEKIRQLKAAQASTPVLLGFGISEIKQVKKSLQMGADGVVIGSKCVDLAINKNTKALETFLTQIRCALDE